ncbi:MAG: alcohol dehydrogenase catalytic domain-containing protein [Clostridia bacterium]|nr:alcohol dehydrogenase catalytic domain-containing protein [Clostridia bacterium]
MIEEMKAVTVYGPGDIRMEKVKMRPLRPDEMLIKVAYTGVCATDLAIFTGDCSFVKSGQIKYPCRIGHEWSGVVCECGSAVKDFKPGDRVITDNGVSCGECEKCLQGDFGRCLNNRSVGTIDCWEGCFAEYMYMPERHTYHLTDNISLRDASLVEPLSISLAGIKKYNITKDSTVAVIGTGAIGIGAAVLAKHMGAKQVIVVGRKKEKLAKALDCGADTVVSTFDGDVVEQVLALTGGEGVDFTLETSGGAETVMQAVHMTKKRGTIALLAFYEKLLQNIDIDAFVGKEQILKGVMGEFGLVEEAGKIMEEGLPLGNIITHEISFDEVPDFFRNAGKTASSRVKAIVKFD